jgi:hypothetical protein
VFGCARRNGCWPQVLKAPATPTIQARIRIGCMEGLYAPRHQHHQFRPHAATRPGRQVRRRLIGTRYGRHDDFRRETRAVNAGTTGSGLLRACGLLNLDRGRYSFWRGTNSSVEFCHDIAFSIVVILAAVTSIKYPPLNDYDRAALTRHNSPRTLRQSTLDVGWLLNPAQGRLSFWLG